MCAPYCDRVPCGTWECRRSVTIVNAGCHATGGNTARMAIAHARYCKSTLAAPCKDRSAFATRQKIKRGEDDSEVHKKPNESRIDSVYRNFEFENCDGDRIACQDAGNNREGLRLAQEQYAEHSGQELRDAEIKEIVDRHEQLRRLCRT